MQKTGRLELTWVGKYNEPVLEPRILLEDKSKSHGDPQSENMLIHGDNLIALQALQQDYAGRIKCIFIDPPYNTGAAFEHYDDNVEHSTWLSLMKSRLVLLHQLLADNGTIFIQIDDNEQAYLKVLCDEIFGRQNLSVTRIEFSIFCTNPKAPLSIRVLLFENNSSNITSSDLKSYAMSADFKFIKVLISVRYLYLSLLASSDSCVMQGAPSTKIKLPLEHLDPKSFRSSVISLSIWFFT